MDWLMHDGIDSGLLSSKGPAAARVLVADDDPASLRFFCDGLSALGAIVTPCVDGHEVLARLASERYDVWLFDCRMPGFGALQIMQQVNHDLPPRHADSFAVATSAELVASERQILLAAGFADLLLKPCTLADLQSMLARACPGISGAALLDDKAALDATGNVGTMQALRQLLHDELVQLTCDLERLAADPESFGDRLHRLRSSCGFCGAAALSAEVIVLQRQLALADGSPVRLDRFRDALAGTLHALVV